MIIYEKEMHVTLLLKLQFPEFFTTTCIFVWISLFIDAIKNVFGIFRLLWLFRSFSFDCIFDVSNSRLQTQSCVKFPMKRKKRCGSFDFQSPKVAMLLSVSFVLISSFKCSIFIVRNKMFEFYGWFSMIHFSSIMFAITFLCFF